MNGDVNETMLMDRSTHRSRRSTHTHNQTIIVANFMLIQDRFPFAEEHTDDHADGEAEQCEDTVGGGPSGVLVWILLLCVQV